MNDILQTSLLFVSAIGAVLAALTGIMALSRRYVLPIILADVTESEPQSPESLATQRNVVFTQAENPAIWLIRDIEVGGYRRKKWLSRTGDGIRNSYGEFVGYSQNSDWSKRISFDPPTQRGVVLLHPDAPSRTRFSLHVVMRSAPRVKRRVAAFAERR